MAFTVRELLDIPYFSGTVVEAGTSGLDNPILTAGILDYEYIPGYDKTPAFLKNDFLISSLLFAKDDEEMLLNAIEKIIEVGVSALAYKPVFYQELPPAVRDAADKAGLVILRTTPDIWMENYLFEVMDHLRLESRIDEKEKLIEQILGGEISGAEAERAARTILPAFEQFGYAVYVGLKEPKGYHFFDDLYRRPMGVDRGRDHITLCRYGNGFFRISSSQYNDPTIHQIRFREALTYLDIDPGEVFIGYGKLCAFPEEITTILQSAYDAAVCAEVTEKDSMIYEDMGAFRYLIPFAAGPQMKGFSEDYLAPLSEMGQDRSSELMATARAFTLSEGDLDETASRLFCHKNTVRYRINSLHELLDPDASMNTFQERLTAAVRIYLLNHR